MHTHINCGMYGGLTNTREEMHMFAYVDIRKIIEFLITSSTNCDMIALSISRDEPCAIYLIISANEPVNMIASIGCQNGKVNKSLRLSIDIQAYLNSLRTRGSRQSHIDHTSLNGMITEND